MSIKEIFSRFVIRRHRNPDCGPAKQKNTTDTPGPGPVNDFLPACDVRTDIVICVHDALDDLKRCLDSVIRNTPESCKLILVNDGSEPETTRFLKQFTEMDSIRCILLTNKTARGYTKAANQGLMASSAEQVILLNSDTIVTPQWIERLTECNASNPAIGIVGPLSNAASWQSVPKRFDPVGDWAVNTLPDGYPLDKMSELIYQVSSKRFPRVAFVNGFCFLVTRSLIQSIGLLDEQAFPDGYGEENDNCLRAAKAGFELAIADHVYVYHAKSRSYSHERRLKLARQGSKALAKKHGVRIIRKGIEGLKKHPDLAEFRQKIRNHYTGGV